MLKARVKKDSKIFPVVSCSGVMFFKETWAIVPVGFEGEAKNNPFLEVAKFKPEPKPEPETKPASKPEPKPEPVAKPEPITSAEVVEDAPNATEEAVKFASEMRVKLSWITGTGKDGRILKSDVEGYLNASS